MNYYLTIKNSKNSYITDSIVSEAKMNEIKDALRRFNSSYHNDVFFEIEIGSSCFFLKASEIASVKFQEENNKPIAVNYPLEHDAPQPS